MPRDARSRPTAALDRRRDDEQKIRHALVTNTAARQAKASLVAALDQRVRPVGMTDAEWACVLVRDATPGTTGYVIAVALACEAADRAEARAKGR